MPGGDGTGPRGLGSMTGRGMGFCAGFNVPGYMNPPAYGGRGMGFGRGRGFGRGMGWGRGWRWNAGFVPAAVPAPIAPAETSVESLKAQKSAMESQIKSMQDLIENLGKRINELESSKE